jgi:hypothetical protein
MNCGFLDFISNMEGTSTSPTCQATECNYFPTNNEFETYCNNGQYDVCPRYKTGVQIRQSKIGNV